MVKIKTRFSKDKEMITILKGTFSEKIFDKISEMSNSKKEFIRNKKVQTRVSRNFKVVDSFWLIPYLAQEGWR